MRSTLFFVLFSVVCFNLSVRAATVTIEDLTADLSGGESVVIKDTMADSNAPTSTAMTAGLLIADNEFSGVGIKKVAFFKAADLSIIPTEAVIQQAKLILYSETVETTGSSVSATAYPVIDVWQVNRVSWNIKSRTGGGGGTNITWNPNGTPTSFNISATSDLTSDELLYDIAEFNGSVQLSNTQTCTGASVIEYDITELMRVWHATPSTNNGVAILTDQTGTAVHFASVNNATIANRPKFVIEYTVYAVTASPDPATASANETDRDPLNTVVTVSNMTAAPVVVTDISETETFLNITNISPSLSTPILAGGSMTFEIDWFALDANPGINTGEIRLTLSGTSVTLLIVPARLNVQGGIENEIVVSSNAVELREQSSTGASLTVSLGAQPNPDVHSTVSVSVSGLDNAGFSPALTSPTTLPLTFTSSTWNVPATITLRETVGDVDSINDGGTVIITGGTGSFLADESIAVTVIDNDPELVVSVSTLTITEGWTATLNIQADRELVVGETMTVNLSFSNVLDSSFIVSNPASGSFFLNSGNWDTGVTVTISASDDLNATNGSAILLIDDAAGIAARQTVALSELDDDTLNIAVTPSTIEVLESDSNGVAVQVSLTLDGSGTAVVTASGLTRVSLTDDAASAILSVSFTASHTTPVTIYVFALADANTIQETEAITIYFTGAGNSPLSLPVTVIDAQMPDYVVTPSSLTIYIGEPAVQLAIHLSHTPSIFQTVTTSIISGDVRINNGITPVDLNFAAGNYSIDKTINVSATIGATLGNGSILISGLTTGADDVIIPVVIAERTYSVSGAITGDILNGVTVLMTGDATESVFTQPDGSFVFANVPNGSYTLTPTRTGYTFSPASSNVTVSGADETGISFVAIEIRYTLSGVVSGLSGASATVVLTGDHSATVNVDTSGYYEFTSLRNGTYGVSAQADGFSIDPLSRIVVIAYENETDVDFIATSSSADFYAVRGSVYGAVESGVTIELSGDATGEILTSATGNFAFLQVENGTYTLTPVLTGFAFTPSSTIVTVNGADVVGLDFSSTRLNQYSITGSVSISGSISDPRLIAVVLVDSVSGLDVSGVLPAYPDLAGDFVIIGIVLPGPYIIEFRATGFVLTPSTYPASGTVTVTADVVITTPIAIDSDPVVTGDTNYKSSTCAMNSRCSSRTEFVWFGMIGLLFVGLFTRKQIA
ncbi:MAG: DUF2012 domain-containing protein [Planctomycetota bacterium]